MSASTAVRAIVADDERLMREQLKLRLAQVWSELIVVAEARDGIEAVEAVARERPDIAFLDIQMPALTGIESAREIALLPDVRCEVVFVTAYDQYAIEAFEQGALDYVLKPAEEGRLRRTVERLKARLAAASVDASAPPQLGRMEDRLAQIERLLQAGQPTGRRPLRWLQATQGNSLRLIAVDQVLFFRSDEKYTRIQTAQAEWLIRTPLRELAEQIDPELFWQIHRGTIVNVRAIDRVERDDVGRLRLRVRGHHEILDVSRGFSHLFRQM
jgi:DNA-binding LytR/AlgR family response regulator